jgi:hypothetical protein
MATFTSAPIGSTLQSLDGLNVSTAGGPALFREVVTIGDPTDGGALAPVNSTVGMSINVASSIPFYVVQSSGPWTISGTTSVNVLGVIPGTTQVNVVSSVPVVVLGSIPSTSQVNVVSSVPITIQGTSSVNVLGSIPGTTQVNVVSSLALTIQGTSTAFNRGNAGAIFDAAPGANAPANGLYMLARVSTSNPATVGNASTVPLMADASGSLVVAEGLRTMMSATTVTLASTSAETTIIPAVASEFHDITNLYICNASSSAQTLTLRDASAGTIRGVYDFNSTFANPININFVPPLAQSTSNANWTIQSVTNTLFHAKVFVAWVRKPT